MLLTETRNFRISNSKQFVERFNRKEDWNEIIGDKYNIDFDGWSPGMFMSDNVLIGKILDRMSGVYYLEYHSKSSEFEIIEFCEISELEAEMGKVQFEKNQAST